MSLRSSISPILKPERLASGLPWCFLPETPGRAILPSCSAEHIFKILSCPDWTKGYCINNFPFILFKGLLLLRAPFKIVLLPSHLIERAHNQTVIWNMHPPKPHNAQESLCFLFASWWKHNCYSVHHICWDLMTPILPFYS